MGDLFNDSDDSTEEINLKTENEYAKRYDTWREKEERHKLEQKYGKDGDLDSSDSEEDDEPPVVSEKLEKDFLKTLSLLKDRDPRIYDPEYKFFEEREQIEQKTENAKAKEEAPKKAVPSLAAAFGASDDESDQEIFTIEKNTEQPERKEDKLKEFLTGKAETLGDDTEKDLRPLKSLWSDPKLNEGEAFLRDYILNKKYLEDDGEGPSEQLRDDADLEADEAIVEEQGKFERAYNFRFEEPDQEFLKRYPRTIGGTRPKDDRRSRKRAEVRERKEMEKKKKMEEIGRLKALKLKEIQEKIEQIKRVTGNKELAFQEADIEGDFDPSEHDRRMAAIFDEEYYGERDEEKPVFPDLDEELEIENWDEYEEEIGAAAEGSQPTQATHCEDQDFNMDADYDPRRSRSTLLEEIKETLGKKRRSRKRKSKLAQLLAAEKPRFDPETTDKTYEEYMEEYYKMDCEDVIGGDLPTRFKYREVVPNSYGLTIEEILLADDKELNKWAPLKKTVKYRPEHVEKGEVKTYQLKANDISLKKKLIPSLFKEVEEPEEITVQTAAKKKKKKRKKNKNKATEDAKINDDEQTAKEIKTVTEDDGISKKSKKKNKQAPSSHNIETHNDTNKTHNDNNKTHDTGETQHDNIDIPKNKDKHNKKNNVAGESKTPSESNVCDAVVNPESHKKKRKKKKKKDESTKTTPVKNTKPNGEIKNLKRKMHLESSYGKKMKFNPKHKQKTKDESYGLSDERLKAYGLNPKKYRNFLKHKKF